MAIATGTAIALAGAAAAGAGAYGAHTQTSSANQAARLQQQGLDEQLAFDREIEARRQKEHDDQQFLLKQQWDADQARREPYRQAAADVLSRWSGRPVAPQAARPMPVGGGTPPPMTPPQTIGSLVKRPPQATTQTLGDLARYWGTREVR